MQAGVRINQHGLYEGVDRVALGTRGCVPDDAVQQVEVCGSARAEVGLPDDGDALLQEPDGGVEVEVVVGGRGSIQDLDDLAVCSSKRCRGELLRASRRDRCASESKGQESDGESEFGHLRGACFERLALEDVEFDAAIGSSAVGGRVVLERIGLAKALRGEA